MNGAGLIDRLEAAAQCGQEVTFLHGASPLTMTWAALHDRARRTAAVLQAQGVAPGGRVALLGETSTELFVTLQACWLAGATVIVLPLRTRLEPEEDFRSRTAQRIALGQVSLTVCGDEFADVAAVGSPGRFVALSDLAERAASTGADTFERPADDPERTAILQFTSGSTADPKGVVIPQRCLLDNIDAILERAPLSVGDDVMVSWLPLYHDMGLVYVAAQAMTTGVRLVLAPPSKFIASPSSWTQWLDEYHGTWTVAPNFAFAMGARLLGAAQGLDLGRVRRMGSGSEPVDPGIMDAFATTAGRHGMDAGALFAGYGMAEATVAISLPGPGSGFAADVVEGPLLEHESRAHPCPPDAPGARRLARCGPPLRGMEVRITDPDTGAVLSDRQAGEIELRGPSVVPGYYERPDATAAAFRPGGWLRSGDLGYLAEGDVVVCGRIKDVIIVGGRNVFPEDLERPVQSIEGVRAGNVIAFGVGGGRKGENVVVVAEVKAGEPEQLRQEIARAVGNAVGLRLDDIVLLAPGTLPKTSSGKLRRSACRARYQSSELESL